MGFGPGAQEKGEQVAVSCAYLTALRLYISVHIGPRMPGPRIRARHLMRLLSQLIPRGGTVLDAGSGKGTLSFLLSRRRPDIKIDAIELSDVLVAQALRTAKVLRLPNVHFGEGNLLHMSAENTYDVIFCCDVLEHIENDLLVDCNPIKV